MTNRWFPHLVGKPQTLTYQDGVDYLAKITPLLPDPQAIDVMANLRDRDKICTWIGNSIAIVNLQLQAQLNACADCFRPIDRRSIHIFAVPLADSLGLDGFCNIAATPMTILVDVGRVAPQDWLALVAHEYAHAHLGYPGHDREYVRVLDRLCWGLGLARPSFPPDDRRIYCWPPYTPAIDPLAWWRGES